MKLNVCSACGFELETDKEEESFQVINGVVLCVECVEDLGLAE